MKTIARFTVVLVLLCGISQAQTAPTFLGQLSSYLPGQSFQVGLTWPALTSGSGSLSAFNVTGLQYFTVNWVVNGSISGCSFTVDGATIPAGSYATGSIVSSQACNSSGTFTTSSATENILAQLTYTFSGAGNVTFTVRGYTENPATAGGSTVSITSPLDGSGNVKVACQSGCAGSNPNGQALMANSAPVVIASNQSAIPASQSGTWNVGPSLSSNALIAGQQAVTASAVALPNTSLARPPCIVAPATNGLTVYVGPSGVTTGTGFPLAPGAALCNLPVSNLNQIFVISSSTGSSVAWSAL